MSIKILIDSASDISQKEAEEMGIYMIPLTINFDGNDYYDGVDLLPEDFYKKLKENKDLPKTSQVNSFRFEEEFSSLTKDGNEVLCITISSKLSGTYSGAVIAAEKFGDKVRVVDSLSASVGERLLCLYALDLINKGKTIDEIVNLLNKVKLKLNIMAVVDTLEYLRKGGRISTITALAGEMFRIKPIICLKDGVIKSISKSIGFKRGLDSLNKIVLEKTLDDEMPYGFIYSGDGDKSFISYVEQSKDIFKNNNNSLIKHIIGCTIGTHVGPGTIGLAFFEK